MRVGKSLASYSQLSALLRVSSQLSLPNNLSLVLTIPQELHECRSNNKYHCPQCVGLGTTKEEG